MAVFSDLGGLFFHSCWDYMAYPSIACTHSLGVSLSLVLFLSLAQMDLQPSTPP